ncbi:uncharacterized protein LOC122005028 [Zingiber officinale]|uniref:uncharacterized protein LOC122005028 n=1 Tax=Zingiber officinale TaxID=94328 RepID=UPI001C4D820C|nr:uncharacterized protein LOC122005028 [Zingiber officinale]
MEYDAEFNRLAEHCPHLVAQDSNRLDQFTQGLTAYICVKMSGFTPSTYLEALDRALVIEMTQLSVHRMHGLAVSLPSGDILNISQEIKECPLEFKSQTLMVDLQVLDMLEFDIILGMDWLAKYYTTVDCSVRVVTFRPPGQPSWVFMGTKDDGISIISTLQARRLLFQGCQEYLLSMIKVDQDHTSQPSDIPIVREYPDVFPDELLGLPPRRQVKFTIELISGTSPVSKALYHITPKELEELKV